MIRKAIKEELGLNSRQVSCRQDNCTMSRSVSVVVKVPVALSKVEEIAKRWKEVRRCEISKDILGGGNCFINVRFERGALDELFDAEAIGAMQEGDSFSEDGVTLRKGEGDIFHLIHDDNPEKEMWCDSSTGQWAGHRWAMERLEALAAPKTTDPEEDTTTEESELFEQIETEQGTATFVDLKKLMGRKLAMWDENFEHGNSCILCARKTSKMGTVIMDPTNGGLLAVKPLGTVSVLDINAHELGMTCMRRANKILKAHGLELQ